MSAEPFEPSHCNGIFSDEHEPGATICISFCLRVAETEPGEKILVVGNDAALGSWSPDNGISLTTSAELYPQWTGTANFVNRQAVGCCGPMELEYKYICDRREREKGSGSVDWETVENRRVLIPFSKHGAAWAVVDACFGQTGSKVPKRIENLSDSFAARYEIVGGQALEKGTFGAVWQCRPVHNGGPEDLVAVKIIDKAILAERDVVNLFGRPGREGEIAIHHRQRHAHIVRLQDFFEGPNDVSLVMELCHGGDLFTCVSSCKKTTGEGISERAAARVALHILGALAFLHGKHHQKLRHQFHHWCDKIA